LLPLETLTWIQVQRGPAAGLWLRVNSRTGWSILGGSSERAAQQALAQHLHLSMMFYDLNDLSAKIGLSVLLVAKLVGPSSSVVSFEADPEMAARLRENVSRNKFFWVTVEQKAVWSERCLVTLVRMDSAKSRDRDQGHIIPACEYRRVDRVVISLVLQL
jgi:hypothetical protein